MSDKEQFAKIFEQSDIGQMLVMIDAGDEGPEIQFDFVLDGLGVCKIALKFSDTDSGWDEAEIAFKEMTLETAVLAVQPTLKYIAGVI